jgi:tetratricopeptide (TPR) repeat protein
VHEVNDDTRFSADYSAMPWRSVDDDGRFRFNLASGRRYEVGIALNSDAAQSVDGYHLQMIGAGFVLRPGETRKVELHFVEPVKVAQPEQDFVYDGQPFSVRWQAYPNARSYRVRLGYVTWGEHGYSSMGTSSMRTIDTHLTIDRIPAIPFGAYGGDAKGVFPTDLIGRPDAYSLQIEAIDEDGNVISSSSGLHFGAGPDPVSVINAKKTTPTEAERLLLERNYDEAVAKLEEAIAKNPDDIRALEILSRVYFMGAYHIGDAVLSDDMAHRDWQRSRDMLTRLVALEPSKENFSALATVCMNMRDRAGAVEAYHMMLDQGSADSSALNLIAYHALTVDDDYLQALAYLEQAKTHAEHYSDVLPLCGLLVLTGHCDEAVQALHTIRSMGVSTFADRGIELERTLRDYAASRSRWSRNWRNDYLGIASQSFREAEQAWRSDAGAHGSFLILIAKLSDPWCHQRRDELQTAMSDFRTKHGKDAPVLLDVLEAFAQVGGV